MSMHWEVWAVLPYGTKVPFWRMQLNRFGMTYGEVFTFFKLDGVKSTVQHHDRLYPVRVTCSFSGRVQLQTSEALQRAGFALIERSIPL